jgi:hypothetical protein
MIRGQPLDEMLTGGEPRVLSRGGCVFRGSERLAHNVARRGAIETMSIQEAHFYSDAEGLERPSPRAEAHRAGPDGGGVVTAAAGGVARFRDQAPGSLARPSVVDGDTLIRGYWPVLTPCGLN